MATNSSTALSNKVILVLDDHPLFREAIKSYLEAQINYITVHAIESVGKLDYLISRDVTPDLILMDLHLSSVNGLDVLAFLLKACDGVPVFVISGNENASSMRYCIDKGACGYIKKSYSVEKIAQIVKDKLEKNLDHHPSELDNIEKQDDNTFSTSDLLEKLTDREIHVMMHVEQGKPNKQIAGDMNISIPTVKAHISKILKKLELSNRAQIIVIANHARPDLGHLYPDIST